MFFPLLFHGPTASTFLPIRYLTESKSSLLLPSHKVYLFMMRWTEEELHPLLLEDGQTVLTTLTNSGYLLYTLNLLKSLRPYGLHTKMLVVCMDAAAATRLQCLGYHAVSVEESEEKGEVGEERKGKEERQDLSRFCPWNTKGYDTICYTKLRVIYRLLTMNKNVLLVDGDVVFRKNPTEDWSVWWSLPPTYDIYIQNDSERDEDTTNLCTGYMWIRSTENTKEVYDCESERGQERYRTCAFDNNDQTYFNRYVKPVCRVQALPLYRYPNGNVYQKRKSVIRDQCVLVHFNWLKGHFKLVVMKQNGMWLLTPEEERAGTGA